MVNCKQNPWWAWAIMIAFIGIVVGGLFAPDLWKFGTLVALTAGGLGCLSLIGIGTFIFWSRRRDERRYRPVDAVVLSMQTQWKDIPSEDWGTIRCYGPVIEYEYQVGGATYRCSTVMSGGQQMRSGHRWAQRILSRYEIGQTVRAFYNEEDPSQAFLVKGDYGVVPFGVVVIGAAGLAGVMWAAQAFGALLPVAVVTGTIAFGIAVWFVNWIGKAAKEIDHGAVDDGHA